MDATPFLTFDEFLTERYVSRGAFALNRIFSKLDPRATKGDQRGGTLTPDDVEVIKATKIGVIDNSAKKWSRISSKSNIPVFRWITFKLTPYGKEQEAVWVQNMRKR
jgi:hypothetical protein